MEESGSGSLRQWGREGRSEERCCLETPRLGGKRGNNVKSPSVVLRTEHANTNTTGCPGLPVEPMSMKG